MSNQASDTDTAKALRKSAVARYLQLASLFRGYIRSGYWAVGEQIPTVEVLARQCGVATMTIRQSLAVLEGEGLVERFRAKGTFVKRQPKHDLWCEVKTDWSGLLMARDNAEIEVLSDIREVSLPHNGFEIVTPGQTFRCLQRRHSRQGIPFLIADVYIAEEICDAISQDDFRTKTAMRLVSDLQGVTIDDAAQIMTIETADLDASTGLDVPLGDPVARVQRTASSNGKLIILANGIYRGDLVRIEMKLR